jgi:hypothetical protein
LKKYLGEAQKLQLNPVGLVMGEEFKMVYQPITQPAARVLISQPEVSEEELLEACQCYL